MRNAIDPKRASNLVVVSGIPPGDSGTGRFVAHLQARLGELVGKRTKVISRPDRLYRWQVRLLVRNTGYQSAARAVIRHAFSLAVFWCRVLIVLLRRRQRMILLHPQNLGYRLALRLIESRKPPSLLYLLDSSFFCVASYNHLQGENGSCLRCIESGFGEIARNGCEPFPRPDSAAHGYAPRLQQLVKTGRVSLAAQNPRQAELAQRHFELPRCPPVIGLWTEDFDEIPSSDPRYLPNDEPNAHTWDVLFHGHCLEAKGATWTAKLARQCPELRFMFPFAKPDWFEAPSNCSFVPCSWDSGLRNELGKSKIVIVPSLWSAPIEGALVKSIAGAKAVAVVENPTSYCDELPAELVLKLSPSPHIAAAELRRALDSDWQPDKAVKSLWLDRLSKNKQSFVPDLLHVALDAQR